MKRIILTCLSFLFVLSAKAQDPASNEVTIFQDIRIINGYSVETTGQGMMKFVISHRFGTLGSGINEFFGLDQATTRIGFDFGVSPKLDVGVGRSGFQKLLDGYVKYKLLNQTFDNAVPLSIAVYTDASIKTLPLSTKEDLFVNRLYYTTQVIMAREFTPNIALQLVPTYSHRNYAPEVGLSNEVFSLGFTGKIRVSRALALVGEVYYTPENLLPTNRTQAFAVGVDLGTSGHVFQMHLSNAAGMTPRQLISETTNGFSPSDLMFGFNISRDFRIAGRKYK